MLLNGKIAEELTHRVEGHKRILFWGDMGVGKSTLAFELARSFDRCLGGTQILSLDPGTPAFGLPGSISRGWWSGEEFRWGDCQALCTLDASRFRLPLVLAAKRLIGIAQGVEGKGPIVIDPPGVVRGVGGAELLIALADTLHADAVVAIYRSGSPFPLTEELASLSVEAIYIPASDEAKQPPRPVKLCRRTTAWDHYLEHSVEVSFSLKRLRVLGTPPPRSASKAWAGRQAALVGATGDTLRMGEVIRLTDGELTLRIPDGDSGAPTAVLIRDAGRGADGLLQTIPRVGKQNTSRASFREMKLFPAVSGVGVKPFSIQVGPAWATLVGGVLGDPLLNVRMSNLKQSLLFDLGDPARLTARAAHQVSAVFLSHAHIDHIGGFLWFLRSRIGTFNPCKIFGPLETITRIENFLGTVTWDRIEENGPVFEVCEILGDSLRRVRLQPAIAPVELPPLPVKDGIILSQAAFDIRAVICDHNIPSVAYALIFRREVNIIKERLAESGLSSGPWLGELKQCITDENMQALIRLPNGDMKSVAQLADGLAQIRPGQKLVYAADVADTPKNREKLIDLARSAHTFFCETAFMQADRQKAISTQHLTTTAALAIAREAAVESLVPFHFSKRYEHNPGLLYNELRSAAGRVHILGPF